jgi:DNA-binding transcriptional ArsR family regulator
VSQHLRVLRSSGLVTVERDGRIARYEVADTHVTHVVDDAVAHVREHGHAEAG